MKINHIYLIAIVLVNCQNTYAALVGKPKINPEQQRWLNEELVHQSYWANTYKVSLLLQQGADASTRQFPPIHNPGRKITPLQAACSSPFRLHYPDDLEIEYGNTTGKNDKEKQANIMRNRKKQAVGVISTLVTHLTPDTINQQFIDYCRFQESDGIQLLIQAGVNPPAQALSHTANGKFLLTPDQAIWKSYVDEHVTNDPRKKENYWYFSVPGDGKRIEDQQKKARIPLKHFSTRFRFLIIDNALAPIPMPENLIKLINAYAGKTKTEYAQLFQSIELLQPFDKSEITV